MFKILITTITIACSLMATGQYVESDTLVMPERLNTVGLNLTPAFVLLMGGEHNSPRYSIDFKRQIDVNKKLRLSVNINEREQLDETGLEGDIIAFTDSTISFRNEHINRTDYDLRFGMEWFKPYQKTTTVYGFDVIAGLYQDRTTLRQVEYLKNDTTSVLISSPYQAPIVATREVDFLYVGADFSIGQRIDISDQINILIQWTPEITYRIPYREDYSESAIRLEPAKEEFHYDIRGIELYFHILF